MVGSAAPSPRTPAPIDSSDNPRFNSATPAGLGALAMTVNPPPATAPATSAYLASSEIPAMSDQGRSALRCR